MNFFLKSIVGLLLITSCLDAKVGVCEVQPEDKKEQFLECLVKEAERTDEVADINMVARWYRTYLIDRAIVNWYEKSIKKGDMYATYEAAGYYDEVFEKPKKAIELYKKSALLNYKDSIAKLSKVMETVYGKEGAIKQYKKEMEEGNKDTYRFLANLYVRYEQYDKALNLYEAQLKKEPKNGDIYALIGSLYAAHLKEEKQAKIYFEKAATLGNALAMYNLGIRAGDAGQYDKAEAYFRASEKAGRENTLGMICYMFQTKLKDDEKAEECNIELAKKGNPIDINELAIFYRQHMNDYANAVYWYKKAYEKGSASAAIGLGAHYSSKYENEYNKEKAIYWYKKAAGMGKAGGWSYLYENEVFK